MRRAAAAAALLLVLLPVGPRADAAAAVCAASPVLASPQDRALLAFARRAGLLYPQAFRSIALRLRDDHGTALPACYLTKRAALGLGWHPGGDLWAVAPGEAIGGDRFFNREGRLPRRWDGRYREADLDYAGGARGSHRLVFVRGMGDAEWLLFVSTDHDASFAAFAPDPSAR